MHARLIYFNWLEWELRLGEALVPALFLELVQGSLQNITNFVYCLFCLKVTPGLSRANVNQVTHQVLNQHLVHVRSG